MASSRLTHAPTVPQLQLLEPLASCRLLSGLSREESLEVLARGCHQEWTRGSYVYRQGDPASNLYLILSGRMRMLQAAACRTNVVVRIHGQAQVFGHAAAVKKLAYVSSAVAVGRCRTVSWSNDTLWRLMHHHPRLAENVLSVVLLQLLQLQDRCLLSVEGVDRRLARTLAQLAFSIGRKSGRSILIDDGFSARDLADLSGTTIFTVSRVLGEWERRGLLNKGRGWVMVHDVDALLKAIRDGDGDLPSSGVTKVNAAAAAAAPARSPDLK